MYIKYVYKCIYRGVLQKEPCLRDAQLHSCPGPPRGVRVVLTIVVLLVVPGVAWQLMLRVLNGAELLNTVDISQGQDS